MTADSLRDDELFGLAARNLVESWRRLSPAKRPAALAAVEAAPERRLFGPELCLVRADGAPSA